MASTDAVASIQGKVTGAGTTVDFTTAKRAVSAVVSLSGAVTSGVVAVEASHDGTVWVKKASFVVEGGRKAWSYDLPHGAYRYWRGNVLRDVAGGGTVSVTFMEAG